MKTSWVLTDAERKQKFENRGKRKSGESGEFDRTCEDVGGGACTSVSHRRVFMNELELVFLDKYVTASDYWEISKVGDMDTGLIRQIIRMVAFRAQLDESGQSQLRNVMMSRSRKFASYLSEFQELSSADQTEILENNLPLLNKLKICSLFNPSLDWTSQLSSLLGSGEVEKLDTKLRSLNVTGLDNLQLTYKQFFPSNISSSRESKNEIKFNSLMINIGSWPQDEREFVLISLLLLFCPDSLNLTERNMVEDIQLKFATLLQKYLNYKHGSDKDLARNRFTSGMLLVSKCKELHSISNENIINFHLTLDL